MCKDKKCSRPDDADKGTSPDVTTTEVIALTDGGGAPIIQVTDPDGSIRVSRPAVDRLFNPRRNNPACGACRSGSCQLPSQETIDETPAKNGKDGTDHDRSLSLLERGITLDRYGGF